MKIPVNTITGFLIYFLLLYTFFIIVPVEDVYSSPATTEMMQAQGQRQPGLPPEKKRTLSNFDPEDLFPGNQGERQQNRPANRQRTSRQNARQTPTPSPSPTASPEAILTPTIDLTAPTQPESTNGVSSNPIDRTIPPAAIQSPPDWLLPTLAALSLVVLTAFIYSVFKLFEKIRVGGK